VRASPHWLRIPFVALAMLALVTFAACGGGDDDDDDGGNGDATATASSDSDGDDGGDEQPDDDDGDGGGDDIFAELDEITGDLDSVTGRVTYSITDSDGTESSITFYAKPPNSRFDSTDGDTTSIIITTPEATYICDSDSETCIATPGSGEDSGSGLLGLYFTPEVIAGYVAIAEAAGIDVERSDDSINGIDATCFSWEEDTDSDVDAGRMCFNDAGVGVYYEFADDAGISKMEATDYSGDVSDSDFDPPYPVTTIPTS